MNDQSNPFLVNLVGDSAIRHHIDGLAELTLAVERLVEVIAHGNTRLREERDHYRKLYQEGLK